MQYVIHGYQPENLFRFFEEISAIPRGSSNEKAVSDYLVTFARERGLWVHQDGLYNVIIKKPASPGCENAPAVMLQGHLDMVCEKLASVDHDFTRDGIQLEVRDGVLRARGTTLGGDNGAAVAAMMAVLDDGRLVHPPLECVFTTQEETGLSGAAGLDKSLLQARIMVNLDSEDEGVATVSCAGGMRIAMTRPLTRSPKASGVLVKASVQGLLGGHSGIDIHRERHNGNLVMARLLHRLVTQTGGQLVSFQGGSKDNAIPREAEGVVFYPDRPSAQAGQEAARKLAAELSEEILPFEPAFSCAIRLEEGDAAPMSREDALALLGAVRLAPNGVRRRNLKENGFVVASLNLGIVRADGETAQMVFSPRSSVASLQEDTKETLLILAQTFGFRWEISGEYPGWRFAENSYIRTVCQESWKALEGKELSIEAIHAGLECGLFVDALPGLDAIAIGPTVAGCHTPDEYLPLDSFARFYEFLSDILARVAHNS